MQLRERSSLRAPARLDEEIRLSQTIAPPSRSDTPPSHRAMMPASSRPAFSPPYAEYNPNLPPAAFPTLDAPVSAARREGDELGHDERGANNGLEGGYGGIHGDAIQGVMNAAGEIVDAEAQHGDSDDENVRTMMESSDEEMDAPHEVVDEEPEFKVPDHVAWADITPTLRAEIIDNMTAVYRWPGVISLLGLTPAERREAAEVSVAYNRQIAREDRQLREMQEKQRRALLRIDHSVLRQMRVPAQLVFRNISKPYLRDPRNRADPDYFMSKASEVLIARQFLRRRGLDLQFAGRWTNGFAAIELDPQKQDVGKLGWTLNDFLGEDARGVEQDTAAQTGVKRNHHVSPAKLDSESHRTRKKVGFINGFGGDSRSGQQCTPYNLLPVPLNVARQILRRKKPQTKRHRGSQSLTGDCSSSNPHSDGTVRLEIGSNGAAKIQSDTSATVPTQLEPVLAPSVPSPLNSFEAAQSGQPQSDTSGAGSANYMPSSPPLPVPRTNVRREHKLPARRILASPGWWHDSANPQRGTVTTHSGDLKSRLLAARAETELERMSQEASTDAIAQGTIFPNLPFRTFPVSSALDSHWSSAPIYPSQGSFGNANSAVPDPILSREGQESRAPPSSLTVATGTEVESATQAEDGENKTPEYSPISPPAVSDAFPKQIERKIGKGDGMSHMEGETSYSIRNSQINGVNNPLTDEGMKEDAKEPTIAETTQDSPTPQPGNQAYLVDKDENEPPAQLRPVPRPIPRGRGRPPKKDSTRKSVPKKAPLKRPSSSQDTKGTSRGSTNVKKAKTEKKEEAPTTAVRRSTRQHGPKTPHDTK